MMRVSLVVTVLEALLNEQHTSTTTPLHRDEDCRDRGARSF